MKDPDPQRHYVPTGIDPGFDETTLWFAGDDFTLSRSTSIDNGLRQNRSEIRIHADILMPTHLKGGKLEAKFFQRDKPDAVDNASDGYPGVGLFRFAKDFEVEDRKSQILHGYFFLSVVVDRTRLEEIVDMLISASSNGSVHVRIGAKIIGLHDECNWDLSGTLSVSSIEVDLVSKRE